MTGPPRGEKRRTSVFSRIKNVVSCFDYARDQLKLPISHPGDRCRSFRPGAENPTSLLINERTWCDFGTPEEQAGGSVIDLCAWARHSGSLPLALEELSVLAGVKFSPGRGERAHQEIEGMAEAVAAFHANLTDTDRAYLAKRHIFPNTISDLQIGHGDKQHLGGSMSGRLVIVYFKNGRPIYCCGRAMEGMDPKEPKYKKAYIGDFTEHPVWGVDTLRRPGTVYIAEGAFDALSCWQEGFPVLSAITGRFSHEQEQDLFEMVRDRDVTVCMDYDPQTKAGEHFTIDLSRKMFGRGIRVSLVLLKGQDTKSDLSDLYASGTDIKALLRDQAIEFWQFAVERIAALPDRRDRQYEMEKFLGDAAQSRDRLEINETIRYIKKHHSGQFDTARIADLGKELKPAASKARPKPPQQRARAASETASATTTAAPIGGTDAKDIRAILWKISQEPKLSATERHRAIAGAVVQWLHIRGRFYYDAERRDFGGTLYFDASRKILLPIKGDAFQAWLSDSLAVNRAERSFVFVQSAVETEGLSERATGIEPATYWASAPGVIYLSNGPGLMARITADDVKLVDNGTDGILFPYGATLRPWVLTEPRDPFQTCALFRDMSTSSPHGQLLLFLWVCSLPSDQKTKPPLVLSGPVGSGKTKEARGIFELYGIAPRIAAVLRNGDSDFWAAMDAGGLSCFDNADTRTEWLADALAAAATAGTLEKRRLYTDADRVSLRARSWVCVTSSSPDFASDPGLADRLLIVRLKRRTGETAESVLSDEIAANRDAGISWICMILSTALRDRDGVPAGLNSRHPDFANLAVRIGRAMGCGDAAVAALRHAEADKSLFNVENDGVGATLLDLLRVGPFTGTAADLLAMIVQIDPSFEGKLSAKRLSYRLGRMWPHLESVFGARVEVGHGGMKRFMFQGRMG